MSTTTDRISDLRAREPEDPGHRGTPASDPAEPGSPARDGTLWVAPGASTLRFDYRPRQPVEQPVAADPEPAPTGIIAGPNDVTAVLDPRGVVVSVSPNCVSLLGFEREELVGVSAEELAHPEDRAWLAHLTSAFARGLTDHLHSIQRLRHKQLGYRLVETALRSTASVPGQRPAGALAVVRAPQGEAVPAGQPTGAMAPAAIGTAYAWVMHGSRRAVIASADPVFASLLHTTTAGLVGRPIEELTDPGRREVGVARFLALLEGSGSTYQVERVMGDGRSVVELTVSLLPLLDKPGHMAVIQARDVSRQREMERAVQDSLTELERSNRELEAFASVAAHDLAAPLRVVVGYAELLAKQGDHVNPQIAELLGKVVNTSRRMQAQVDGLMTLARIESEDLTTRRHDMRMLVEEALEGLEDDISRARARIRVGAVPVITCNATGVVQILQNLISNAIKYGGETPLVEIESSREAGAWRFTVADRGNGLPECPEADLFELFQRGGVRSGASGAGIGLAVCKRIVERHGGRIWCQQRAGGGALFHFTLRDCSPTNDPPARSAEPGRAGGL